MEYRNLGCSGLQVSPICLGAMNFGGPTDAAEALRLIGISRDAGVNFIDTPPTSIPAAARRRSSARRSAASAIAGSWPPR